MGKAYEHKSQGEVSPSAKISQKKGQGGESAIGDRRPEAAAQRKLQAMIQGDSSGLSQRKEMPEVSETAQRAMEEEEKMGQGKFILQREGLKEDEELPK